MRYIAALVFCLMVGCATEPVGNPVDCDVIDRAVAASDECDPSDGIGEKWSDIRADVCDGAGADCRDIMPAIEHANPECKSDIDIMIGPHCN